MTILKDDHFDVGTMFSFRCTTHVKNSRSLCVVLTLNWPFEVIDSATKHTMKNKEKIMIRHSRKTFFALSNTLCHFFWVSARNREVPQNLIQCNLNAKKIEEWGRIHKRTHHLQHPLTKLLRCCQTVFKMLFSLHVSVILTLNYYHTNIFNTMEVEQLSPLRKHFIIKANTNM